MIPSSAQRLLAELATQGIGPQDLRPEHLAPFLATLDPWHARPRFRDLPIPDAAFPERPPQRQASAVIIETRATPALDFVLRNIIGETGLFVQLFHSAANAECLRAPWIAQQVAAGRLQLNNLGCGAELLAAQYNALLLKHRFWRGLAGQKVLIFQTDSMVCPDSPHRLDAFLHFDLIGARWGRTRSTGLVADGGEGGFSLRSRTLALQSLRRFPPWTWPAGEDDYFAFHFELLGGRLATQEECDVFACQRRFHRKSFGCHKIGLMPSEEHQAFLAYCPEARNLLNADRS